MNNNNNNGVEATMSAVMDSVHDAQPHVPATTGTMEMKSLTSGSVILHDRNNNNNNNQAEAAEEEQCVVPLLHNANDVEELWALLQDVAQMLLSWSWEGVMGIEEALQHIVQAYHVERGIEKEDHLNFQCLVWAQEAMLTLDGRTAFIRQYPGFPALKALNAYRRFIHRLKGGELTIQQARQSLEKDVKSIEAVWPKIIRLLGCECLTLGFTIDIVQST